MLRLAIPIFIETFLFMLSGIADTLILSNVSDNAVAAVGTVSTYNGMFFLIFSVVSSGVLSVMSQYIGAQQKGVAFQARQLAIVFNGVLGLILSFAIGFGAETIIRGLRVAEALREDAILYFRIVGAGCVLDALVPVFAAYLRAFDHTKYSLIGAASGAILNLILNTLFVFAFKFGIMGVAFATIAGKALNLFLCLWFGFRKIKGLRFVERTSRVLLIRQIAKVGLPAAVETAVYSLAMAATMTFLNWMDPNDFNAASRSYASTITSFAYCVSLALAQANIIMVGWAIGKGRIKDCYPNTTIVALIGNGTGIVIELIFAIVSPWMLHLFTHDPELIRITTIVLYIDIILEVGRSGNIVFGGTLKSTGDSFIPMVYSVIITSICVVGGVYLFGNVLGLGVLGAYIGRIADECLRAIFMFFRWRSGKWEKKVLISKAEVIVPPSEMQ